MFRKTMFAPLLAASAMALTVTPAYAGKADRAREAIAAAEAKIHTAETMGASSELPHEAADARASLAMAREKLSAGHKSDSIAEAIHAQQLADTAIGVMQRRKDQAVADAQRTHSDVVSAQQQAAEANRRADVAQQQAANSAADAAAARNAAVAAQNQQAQVETTVTTQQPAPATSRTKARHTTTITKRTVVAPATTTTTVRQGVN
jgi:uncharacterized phage infection (PIP) family protein YhgE